MNFKFNYERLLEFYRQQEVLAQRDYSESLHRLDEEKKLYRKMFDDEDRALDEGFKLKNNPNGAPIGKLIEIDLYLGGQKVRIAQQREVIINLTKIVEQKQEILIAAAKEFKTLEKLKERRLLEFKKMQKKREAKINDELVVTRFRREGTS